MKKSVSLIAFYLLLFTSLSAFKGAAQTLEDVKTQMVKDWERAKLYTVDYLNTMPADKYSFRAVDSIRSFAKQMVHLAKGSCFLMSNATDEMPPPFSQSDVEQSPAAQNKDSVMYYVIASYDYCLTVVKNFDVKKWFEKKKTMNEETRFALMNKAFEHQTHHRGQTTIYIRLQGIKPPNERLF